MLKRPITAREYNKVLDHLLDRGLERVFLQGRASADTKFIPDFSEEKSSLF